MLVDVESLSGEEFDTKSELFLKHFIDEEFLEWALKNWFLELNQILKDKQVLHVLGFPNTLEYFPLLDGLKYTNNLFEQSLTEVSHQRDKFIFDTRPNHFSSQGNQRIATEIFDQLTNSNNH
jgi:hypothetical protein